MTVETWLITAPQSVFEAILDVVRERSDQDEIWGEQSHPDGTGPLTMPLYVDAATGIMDNDGAAFIAETMKGRTEFRFSGEGDRPGTFADILLEEVFEALAEDDPVKLREELVQVAAVAVQWVEKLDREARR